MFEASVDGFGGAVAGVGVVEVGQDVCGSAFECPAQGGELGQAPRYGVVRKLLTVCLCGFCPGRLV